MILATLSSFIANQLVFVGSILFYRQLGDKLRSDTAHCYCLQEHGE